MFGSETRAQGSTDTSSPGHRSDIGAQIRALDQQVEVLLRVDAQEALRLADTATALSEQTDAFYRGVALRARANALRLLARYGDSIISYTTAEERFRIAGDALEAARTLVGKVDALI